MIATPELVCVEHMLPVKTYKQGRIAIVQIINANAQSFFHHALECRQGSTVILQQIMAEVLANALLRFQHAPIQMKYAIVLTMFVNVEVLIPVKVKSPVLIVTVLTLNANVRRLKKLVLMGLTSV